VLTRTTKKKKLIVSGEYGNKSGICQTYNGNRLCRKRGVPRKKEKEKRQGVVGNVGLGEKGEKGILFPLPNATNVHEEGSCIARKVWGKRNPLKDRGKPETH